MTYKDAAAAAEAAKAGAGEEPSSEYESIDPSIFGRVKAKIRKSQVTIQSLKYLRKCVISDGKVMRTSLMIMSATQACFSARFNLLSIVASISLILKSI